MVITRERMTLLSDDANEVFGGGYQPIDGDSSISALLRAIVLKYGNYNLEELSGRAMVGRWRARTAHDVCIYISSYSQYALTIIECVGCFDDEFDIDPGWEREFTFNGKAFPVNQYLSQFGRTKILVNKEEKRLVALVDRRATNIWVQALESVMCRLMPWYYPVDLPEEEQNFYKAIAVDNKTKSPEEKADVFVKYVNKIAETMNFREMRLHRLLDGVADKARQSKLRVLSEAISNSRAAIRRATSDIKAYTIQLSSYLLEHNALTNAEPQADSSMFDFFNSHNQVQLLDVFDNSLRFGVDDTLEFYDEDEFSAIVNNRYSFLYEYAEGVRKGLKAIFADRKGVIRVNAVFELYDFKLVDPREDESFVENAMPNPHIYFFGCSGGNSQYYTQYAESGDWDLGIEQAISATKNINWGDTTVCKEMIRWLTNHLTPCIYINDDLSPVDRVNKDMKLVSFTEFLKMLEAKESEENNG